MKKWINNIGPGPLIAAAFIGPGTVTLCSIAGLDFGFSLLMDFGAVGSCNNSSSRNGCKK